MRLFVNTGDSGLGMRLKEAKATYGRLKKKTVALGDALEQLRKQVNVKVELEKQVKEYMEENKVLVNTIKEQEERLKELMEDAA